MLSHAPSMDEVAVVDAVVTGLRWVAVALGAYLIVSLVASFSAHALQLGRLVRVADAVTLPPVRRLVRAAVGAGVAAGTFMGTTGVSGASAAASAAASADSPVPVMRRLGDEAPAKQAERTPAAAAAPAPSPPANEWTVRPGDHFWRIAEEVLATHLHREPGNAETDPYWRRLVTANRDRLADRANPDLLFPGQVLTVPPAATGA